MLPARAHGHPTPMPKFLKILLACAICAGVAGLAIWLLGG
jgi:hypothetical protein